MSVDKVYCMSSYLALRYIEDDDKDFFEGMRHRNIAPYPDEELNAVSTAVDIDKRIEAQAAEIHGEKPGIMLSGGMDSAILASYFQGCDAYTFRFLGGDYQKEELQRAEFYAKKYHLTLHYVDISWDHTIEPNLDLLLKAKAAPVHSIEPQIRQAAMQAKHDGITLMIIGESSDLKFGGMDQLLSRNWTVDEFKQRYTFTRPESVLREFVDMSYIFERYSKTENQIDFLKFMDDIFSIESSSSYLNAFESAELPYLDPYMSLKMAEPLDLARVRHGESKYLIRELFTMKYPEIPVPEKVPMPRPVDFYFKDWAGPVRPEFKENLDMSQFSGNQKWQLWCLERFLNLFAP